ncbi:ricin-type beta-trefoil lectin domain protein [Streptomyces avidinii]|uniref:ricin-type beta-trefoil lectin domain protein n=1 Tax=Streptomyces TaxID=1883 RepID=UPI002E2C65CC|nr:ricin-type beta-trefoil lectin domain protein [Streptomyces sp. NBC_00273]WST43432.1 ricin-type beta-trefoil lectin domain protein [Streptomyces avidinii]WTA95551.1 ricin-type beta-trefoil lectin domain protein [Streptomyces avidinii]
MTDQQLCDTIRTADPAAPSAETELRGRHGPRVSAFARTVCGDLLAARRAADRATEQFLDRLAATTDALDQPPRLALLALVSASASPAPPGPSGAGSVPLDPGLQSFVRKGFVTLSPRTQSVLWHSVVEREPDEDVATITGDRPEVVPDLAHRALVACRDAFLRVHLQARPTPHCPAYARMLDAAAGRADVRENPDLTRHVDGCPGCAAALRGLVALCDTPGPLLAGSLLGPAGPLYLSAATRTDQDSDTEDTLSLPVMTATGVTGGSEPTAGDRKPSFFVRRPAGRISLAVAAALITTTALAVVVPTAWGPEAPATAQGQPPRVHVEAGAGAPAPSASRSRPSASASPTRSPSASPSATGPSPSDGPTPSPTPGTEAATADPVQPFRASSFVPAVNSATGLCLDVRGGTFANGVDVITARCRAGAPVQQWRLDERGLLRNAANPSYCMDARGSAGDGVGIWSCSAIGGAEGNNLVFSTDATGRIKPRIAPGYAVTSGSGEPGAPVTFGRTGPAAEQRWNEPTGQSPSSH